LRITLLASGKPEDADSLLALGLGLQEYGHRPLLAAPAHYRSYIGKYPLRYQELAQPWQREWHASLVSACEHSDLLVFHSSWMFEAATLSELLQKPILFVAPSPLLPARPGPFGGASRWAYRLAAPRQERERARQMNAWRAESGLRPVRGSLLDEYAKQQVPFLHAYSAFLAPLPKRWDASHHYISGAIVWHKHPASRETLPSRETMEAWTGQGQELILFHAGRKTKADVEQLAAWAAEAARKLALQAIIAVDGSSEDYGHLPDGIRVIPAGSDYRWLYAHCRCVVHPGDAAVTQSVLAAGTPSIILASDADQIYWGNRLDKLQAGVQMPLSAANPERIIQALHTLQHGPFDERAKQLGARMRQEDGLRGALEWMIRIMPSAPVFAR